MPCATQRAYRKDVLQRPRLTNGKLQPFPPMSMSGAITVDTTAGGVSIISTGQKTRLVTIANTGSQPCALKFDQDTTALTYANGHPLAAGEKIIIGLGQGPWGSDVPMNIKAIASGSGSTTVTAQCAPF